jgi:hypothetical protein
MTNPYQEKPKRSFWKPAVAERHVTDFIEMWEPMPLSRTDKIATAGSCFAQHFGRHLQLRGANYMECEPAPPLFIDKTEARKFGFGVFSCRYGNIYTSRQLLQLAHEALGKRRPTEFIWQKKGRFFDALRPGVDPVGQATEEDVLAERKRHLTAVRLMLSTLNVFVFTLGLTEGWISLADNTIYPTAPGTIAGDFDSSRFSFINLRYEDVLSDMRSFWFLLKSINPKARMLLTVSPVPLAATATNYHVIPATTYSKSVLRAVAGDLSADHKEIFYFPSYELIISHPMRGMFFKPNLREVAESGVNYVMSHFFTGKLAREFGSLPINEQDNELLIFCEEGDSINNF